MPISPPGSRRRATRGPALPGATSCGGAGRRRPCRCWPSSFAILRRSPTIGCATSARSTSIPIRRSKPCLIGLLGGKHPDQAEIGALALKQLHGAHPDSPEFKAALSQALDGCRGTDQFLDLVLELQHPRPGRRSAGNGLGRSERHPRREGGTASLAQRREKPLPKSLAGDDATAEKALHRARPDARAGGRRT